MTTELRVTERFLAKRTAAEDDSADTGSGGDPGRAKTVSPLRFLDLANLVIAFDAYAQHTAEAGPLMPKGVHLIRRFFPDFEEGIKQYIQPLVDRSDASILHTVLMRGQRSAPPPQAARYRAEMLVQVLPWLRMHSNALNDVFPGRASRTAREMGAMCEEASLPTRINRGALITPLSGISTPRSWIEAAAAETGMPVTPTESSLIGAQIAKGLGEDLAKVEASLVTALPNTETAADLQEQRTKILGEIEQVAQDTNDRPTILAAAAMARPTHQYATETGKRLGHTPDQEEAMMARGRALIAAGAGSGKTRVLASKVAYHIIEGGIDPAAILATSFTTKASAELIARCEKYGAVIEGPAKDGFGTTHSIAGKFLNRKATQFRRPSYIGKGEMWKQTALLRLAMEQVKMGPFNIQPPKPKGIWEGVFKGETPQESRIDPQYAASIDDAIGYFTWAARTWSAGPGGWAARQIPFLQDMRRQDPAKLSPRQRQVLNDLFLKVKRGGVNVITYRVASEGDATEETGETPSPKRKQSKMEQYTFYKTPARQWFNLGRKLTRPTRDGTEVAIPLGEFKNGLSILKGQGLSPSEVWAGKGPFDAESDEAAVYAAYEWLKGSQGEPEFSGVGDMDDILIDTVTALVAAPNLRRQMNSQYKVLLIDEAQDLNRVQHLLFGLIAGYLDPATMQPWPDKHMTADTFAYIGDDKQCLARGTLILLADKSEIPVEALNPGDTVLAYRNGAIVPQTVRHVIPSGWDRGYKIQTASGRTLTMSPNHKLWATEPVTGTDESLVYLMHRRDLGFRVGITGTGRDDDHIYLFGQRPVAEKAERLWVLDICKGREEALTKENQYSLRYSIPTLVYHTEGRKMAFCHAERIQTIFEEFGENGLHLLETRGLSFAYPHWMARTFTKEQRYTIQMVAHGPKGTQVMLEVGPEVNLGDIPNKETAKGTRVVRKWFLNYREALCFAENLQQHTGVLLSQTLSSPEGSLRMTTAAGLLPGMEILVREEDTLTTEEIVSVEQVSGGQFFDVDVEDASNLFANQALVSNSLYEFRGADPDEFIEKSDLTPGGDNFKTKLLDTNFRSGQAIVDAANKLIARNEKQVPMTCKANIDRNGMGSIVSRPSDSVEEAALTVAEEIEGTMEAATPGSGKYKDFGVAVRSNAEAYAYGLEMLKKGIPFKSNARFFDDPATKALIGWMTIAEKGLDGPAEEINDALQNCVRAPYSKLGKAFFVALNDKASGSWARWLIDGGTQKVYQRYEMIEAAQHFAGNLQLVSEMSGPPAGVLAKIMLIKGLDGDSLRDSLVQAVVENDDLMAELSAQAEGGKVTDDMILDQALAPVSPLISLMEGREDIGSAMTFVRKLQQVNSRLATKDTEEEIDRDAVTIGTMHSWKGLEVPTMFIPMVGGKFPRTGKEGIAAEGPDLWSERRLAYVAVTRAEQRCVILDIPHPTHGTHSQFIDEACIPIEGMTPKDGVPKVGNRVWDDAALLELSWGAPLEA
jgi:DNA helicase II / ATP-dependent DNA helicase PcrA